MPSPAAVYATRKPALFKKHGKLIAREARCLGFNTVFAPVLDLALPASASVMRTRAVSADPAEVTAYAEAFLQGFAAHGIVGCGKHFPGLGGGNLDSHHAMPVIQRSWEEIWNNDMKPFRALTGQLPMIMVATPAKPTIIPGQREAHCLLLSAPFCRITEVLRRKLRYTGLIISDDMEMGGILTQRSMEEAAVEAIAAGTDILEICKDPSLILRTYEALLAEAERSPSFRRRVQQSTRRILRFKAHRSAHSLEQSSRQTLEELRHQVQSFLHQIETR